MSRKLTISVDERVYEGLQQVIGPEHISQFIEDLVRPHIIHADLTESYRLMAADEARESEAHEWVENTCGDVADEAR
ncbi:MAG: hypothetical protein QOK37_3078 [Thermoanaerobaculia bacterium]|jgi:predicted CopG family antitoxin|nr:hypothetical protein [Thermoanaerobaculia bacterium]